MENFINFCANLYIFFKIFSKVFDEYIFSESPPLNQNPGAATVHYSLCMKKKGCLLYIFRFVTIHNSISTDFSITLFGFLSSLAFNNRIENLTLITKFGGPYFLKGPLYFVGPEAVPLLPPSRAGPEIKIYEYISGKDMYMHSNHRRSAHRGRGASPPVFYESVDNFLSD